MCRLKSKEKIIKPILNTSYISKAKKQQKEIDQSLHKILKIKDLVKVRIPSSEAAKRMSLKSENLELTCSKNKISNLSELKRKQTKPDRLFNQRYLTPSNILLSQ